MKEYENSEGFEIEQRFEHPSFGNYLLLPEIIWSDIYEDVHFPILLDNIAILKLKNKISFNEKVKPALFFEDNSVNRTELRSLTAVGFSSDLKVKKIGNLNESLLDNYNLLNNFEREDFEGSIFAETNSGFAGKFK